MPDASRQFGSNLRQFREMRMLTQAALGERAGIAAASVSHFETGQRAPSLNSLVKLADALDLSVDSLLGREHAESSVGLDPVLRQASRASTHTLDTVRAVAAALLRDLDKK